MDKILEFNKLKGTNQKKNSKEIKQGGEIVEFKNSSINTEEKESVKGLSFEEFAATIGSYSNANLDPAYIVEYEDVDGFDGKVTNLTKLSKDESYMSLLSSGTFSLFELAEDGEKLLHWTTAELEGDIESTDYGKYHLVAVFKEELDDVIFKALKQEKLYISLL